MCALRNKIIYNNLELSGTGNPSRVQINCGGGFPVATHLRDTAGPGWRVCSVNQCSNSGLASEN